MKQLVIAVLFLSLTACKKGKTPKPVLAPQQAVLISPAANEACTQGNVISSSESTVTLKWNAAENTDSYEVNVKNLLNGTVVTQSTTETQLSLNLARNTPYSWYVISKSEASSNTAQSNTWKFYNSGEATVSYAPFPAENLVPAMQQVVSAPTGKVSLTWDAEDVDGDISGFDVYMGTSNNNLVPLQSDITAKRVDDVTVSANTSYYWKVITKDAKGNSSDSGIYVFTVN